MTELQKVSAEMMRFMHGKYALDEVGKYNDKDCLKFRQGKRTILSINIHEDPYEFQIIPARRSGKIRGANQRVPKAIQDLYHESRALPDGLWLLIRVDNLETLEVGYARHQLLCLTLLVDFHHRLTACPAQHKKTS